MIIRYQNESFKNDRSIIVAGPRASGKSHLIDSLAKYVTAFRMVHRPDLEKNGQAAANSIIHWPIAEKFPAVSLSNVGLVLFLQKNWADYCANVNKRNHLTQYSEIGLRELFQQWEAYFTSHNLPIVVVGGNDCDMKSLLQKIIGMV